MVYDSTLGFSVPGLNPETWNGWRNYLLKGQVNDGNAWYAGGGVSGAAGLFSNAADIEKLLSMILNKGKIGKKEFVSAETISLFLTKDKFKNGLGWMMDPTNSFMKNAPEGSFGHTGFTGTSITVVPNKKIFIIILINRQNTGLNKEGTYFNVNPIRAEIFETVLKALD
jgi:CubicO group peptidase (beta-lactamase class C family)